MITKRLETITRISKEYLSTTPPIPKSVKIELTPKCNYNCQFCSIVDREIKYKDMDWDLFVKIVNELNELGVSEIGLFMIGEPFSGFKGLIRAIKYLKHELNFPYVFITSNGSLASADKIKACMDLGLDSIKWSCNVADETQFVELLGAKPELFQNVKNNIKNAFIIRNNGKYNTRLYASSIRYDDKQFELMQPFLSEFIIPFVDEHYWLPLYSMGGASTERENKLGYNPIAGNSGRYDDPVDPIPCWSLFTAGHILSDGTVTACCADGSGNWAVGNMMTDSFSNIWNNDKFSELRRAHLNNNIIGTKCEYCALGK